MKDRPWITFSKKESEYLNGADFSITVFPNHVINEKIVGKIKGKSSNKSEAD